MRHTEALHRLLEKARIDPEILAVMVFGSAARGEETDKSDLDLCLVLTPSRHDPAALGIEGLHDVADRAVLAGGVDALEHDQDSMAVLRVQDVLDRGQPVEVRRRNGLRAIPVVAEGLAGVDLRQPHARAGLDAQCRSEVRSPLCHGASLGCTDGRPTRTPRPRPLRGAV